MDGTTTRLRHDPLRPEFILLSFPASLARLNLRLYSQEALRLSAWILTLALPTLGRTSTGGARGVFRGRLEKLLRCFPPHPHPHPTHPIAGPLLSPLFPSPPFSRSSSPSSPPPPPSPVPAILAPFCGSGPNVRLRPKSYCSCLQHWYTPNATYQSRVRLSPSASDRLCPPSQV